MAGKHLRNVEGRIIFEGKGRVVNSKMLLSFSTRRLCCMYVCVCVYINIGG